MAVGPDVQGPRRLAGREAGNVVGVRGVPAQKAMVAQEPQIARLDAALRLLRQRVRIGEVRALRSEVAEQAR